MASDLEALQGTWHIVTLELDGDVAPPRSLDDATIVVTGTSFVSLGMGDQYEGALHVDETATPKAFDLVFASGPQAGTRNLGIYTLENGVWTICLATRGSRRPKTFATKAGTGLALETLRRAKVTGRTVGKKRTAKTGAPPSRGNATTPRAVTEAGARPATEIEGEWRMTRGIFNGAALDASMVAYCRRVTRGDVTTVLAGPKVMMSARFTLDPSTTPRQIDYLNLAGSHAGKTQQGIYELDGDSLRISIAAPGHARPSDFSTAKGDGRTLTVFARTLEK